MTDRERVIRDGFDLVSGGVTLVAMRALLVLLASLPGLLLILSSLAGGAARQPYFTDVSGRLPLEVLMRLSRELSGFLSGAVALTMVLVLLGEQVLMAGALEWLNPRSKDEQRSGRPWREVPRVGIKWIWPMLKVVLLAVIFAGIGMALIGRLFEALARHGAGAGWTGYTQLIVLPGLRAACSVVWLALVGAWAFWCRVLLVADGRRTVRSTWLLVLRVWRRHPWRGPLFYVLVTLASQAAALVVLALWRQRPPAAAWGVAMWVANWLLTVVLQAYLWYWLVHAGRLLYAMPGLDDIRRRPDGPIGIGRAVAWLAQRFRRGEKHP